MAEHSVTYPAISLWQPYATLIAVGAKPFETRHWCAPRRFVGQRVAIHAAARRPTRAEVDDLFEEVAEALGFCHWHLRIPYGAIVCTATLAGCHQVRSYGIDRIDLGRRGIVKDDGFGDYHPGRWCWEMTDIEPLNPAVPARGAQGWWTWSRADG